MITKNDEKIAFPRISKEDREKLRRFYQRIGSRGGQAGKGTQVRKELMVRAANIRWARYKDKVKQMKRDAKLVLSKPKRKVLKVKAQPMPKPTPMPVPAGAPAIGFK